MIILPFEQKLDCSGYQMTAVSNIASYEDDKYEYQGVELKMEPIISETLHRPMGGGFEKFLEMATPYKIEEDDDEKDDADLDFEANYQSIFYGKNKDWVLSAIEVESQHLGLLYIHKYIEHGCSWLLFDEPYGLYLKFIGPRTRMGFDPVCQVMLSGGNSSPAHVIEDLGYMQRDGHIIRKNDDLYFEGRVYTGF